MHTNTSDVTASGGGLYEGGWSPRYGATLIWVFGWAYGLASLNLAWAMMLMA